MSTIDGPAEVTSVTDPTVQADASAAGDSAEQRAAEGALIAGLGQRLGVRLEKRRITLPGGGSLEVDGVSDSPAVVCEAWAHLGPAKSAQKNKLLADAFKLDYAAQFFPQGTRKILAVADPQAVQHLSGKSWMGQALRARQIEIEIVALPAEIIESVKRAQDRQYR